MLAADRPPTDTEHTMSNPRNDPGTPLLTRLNSFRLTNGIIALTTRLFTSSALAIVRASQRKRLRW